MSATKNSSPEPDAAAPRGWSVLRPLIAPAIIALIVVVVLVAVLPRLKWPSAPSYFHEWNAKADSQTFSMAMKRFSSPGLTGLDPIRAGADNMTTEAQLTRLLFDGLVTLDDNNRVEMWAADRLTISADLTTYAFHIRDHETFSDNSPLKPTDFAWSMDRALNPCVAAALGYGIDPTSALMLIKDGATFAHERCASDGHTVKGSITTLVGDSIVADNSANTLTITLAHPAGYFLTAMTRTESYVVERAAMHNSATDTAWLNKLSSGLTGKGESGMFYLASWDQGDNLVLKPNPNWWGTDAGKTPNLTELDIHLYDSNTLDYQRFESSSYDYLDAAPLDSPVASQSRPDSHLIPLLFTENVEFDWNTAPFNNADARQALCLALNRDALAQDALKGAAVNSGAVPLLPSWHLVPQGMPGYNAQLTGIDGVTATSGDLTRAQAHWQAYLATLNGKAPPAVEYLYSSASPTQSLIANDIVTQWSTAFPGLNVSKNVPHGVLQVGSYPFQSARFAWIADYPDPRDFLSLLYSTGAAYNIAHSSVPSADALLAEADKLSLPADVDLRIDHYRQAEQQLVQQVATCPLFQRQSAYLLKSDIAWMRLNSLGFIPNFDWINSYRMPS